MTAPERGTATTRFELARRVGPYAPRTSVRYAARTLVPHAARTLDPCAARTLDNVARTFVAAGRRIRRHTPETDGRTHCSAGSSS